MAFPSHLVDSLGQVVIGVILGLLISPNPYALFLAAIHKTAYGSAIAVIYWNVEVYAEIQCVDETYVGI